MWAAVLSAQRGVSNIVLLTSLGAGAFGKESRLRKSAQGDKWSFCLTAGKIGPRIRRDDEQTSTPEPHTGFQGEGGACRRQGRSNTGSTGGAVRRAPLSNSSGSPSMPSSNP